MHMENEKSGQGPNPRDASASQPGIQKMGKQTYHTEAGRIAEPDPG